MGSLTDKAVRSVSVTSGEKYIADGDGLYIRVRMDGGKTWFFRYTSQGKAKKIQLGVYPGLSLAQARQRTIEMNSLRRSGTDPAESREKDRRDAEIRRAQDLQRVTFATLYERWSKVEAAQHKDGGDYVAGHIRRYVLPAIGSTPVEDVTKKAITEITDSLVADGKNSTARQVFRITRQILGFAVDREIITSDPTTGLKQSKIGGRVIERDRVLSDEEIKLLMMALEASNMIESNKIGLMILLSTGARIGELSAARWEHFDLEQGTWLIPKEHSKNKVEILISLSAFALKRIKALHSLHGAYLWAYPNRKRTGSVDKRTITTQVDDRQQPDGNKTFVLPGGKWTPHDLRRTAATTMVALGVVPDVAERCLNHVEQNRVKRTYQRYDYAKEMKAAWDRLGAHLEELEAESEISR